MIKNIFGDVVKLLKVSLIKLMIGYLLGVIGGIEVIFFVLLICDLKVVFIIYVIILDEECDLDIVLNVV